MEVDFMTRPFRASLQRYQLDDTDTRRRGREEPVGTWDTAASALDALSTDLALAVIAALPREQAQAVLLRAVVGLDARTAGQIDSAAQFRDTPS
jgi:DNA-directed RNA polymerase specialized sigma24 family protein